MQLCHLVLPTPSLIIPNHPWLSDLLLPNIAAPSSDLHPHLLPIQPVEESNPVTAPIGPLVVAVLLQLEMQMYVCFLAFGHQGI